MCIRSDEIPYQHISLDQILKQYRKRDNIKYYNAQLQVSSPPPPTPDLPPVPQDWLLTYRIPCPKSFKKIPSPRSPSPPLYQHAQNTYIKYKYDAPAKNWATKELMAQCIIQKMCHIYDRAGHNEYLHSLLRGPQRATWNTSLSKVK